MSASAGSARMQAVAQAIREGAMAYLRRQFRVMIWFVAAMAVILYLLYANLYGGLPGGNTLALGVAGAFLAGCAASYGAGFVGMMLAVRGNVRAAHAALTSPSRAMKLAFNKAAIAGFSKLSRSITWHQ